MSKKLKPKEDMTDHIGELETVFNQLDNAGLGVNELMQVSILLSSIKDCPEYKAVVAAIRTMDEKSASWESVTTRLIDEYKEKKTCRPEETSVALLHKKQVRCRFCKKKGHIDAECWDNPKGEKYRGNRDAKEKNKKGKNRGPVLALMSASSRLTSSASSTSGTFILDSGATHHMCYEAQLFRNISEGETYTVTLGDSSTVQSNLTGEIDIILDGDVLSVGNSTQNSGSWIRLTNVLLIQELGINLISASVLDDHGLHTHIAEGRCRIVNSANDTTLGYALKREDGLYEITGSIVNSGARCNHANKKRVDNREQGLQLWHRRLAHNNLDTIKKMSLSPNVKGLSLTDKPEKVNCEPCVKGKKNKGSYKGNLIPEGAEPGDVIFSDVCGPFSEESWGKAKYFVSFIDGASRYVTVSLMLKKTEVFRLFTQFKANFETQYATKIKRIHTDNGTEYVNIKMHEYTRSNGIVHSTTAPYNPQSNGVAERMNQTLMSKVRAMLLLGKLSGKFWAEALLHAVFIQNRLSIKALDWMSPFTFLTGLVPNLSKVRVFGSRAYVVIDETQRSKLDEKAKGMILLGISDTGIYRVFDPESLRVTTARHVVVDESNFPGYPIPNAVPQVTKDADYNMENELGTDDEQGSSVASQSDSESFVTITDEDSDEDSTDCSNPAEKDPIIEKPEDSNPPPLRRSTRERRRPKWLIEGMLSNAAKKKQSSPDMPSLREAMASSEAPQWEEAIVSEITELKARGTWKLVPRPKKKKVLPCKSY